MIYDDDKLFGGDVLLMEKQRNPLVSTEKTGHAVSAEKRERMFIFYEENIAEFHSIKVSNNIVWANFNKSNLDLKYI